MPRAWTVNSYCGANLIAHDEYHKQAIADAALAALLAQEEKPNTKSGSRLRQVCGTVLIQIGQRLHGTVVHSTDMLPAASR
jgi:hypothetical protein